MANTLKTRSKPKLSSQLLFVFALCVLILWVCYNTYLMGSESIARGTNVVGTVAYIIGGTIFDLRTVALFIGVVLLGLKLKGK